MDVPESVVNRVYNFDCDCTSILDGTCESEFCVPTQTHIHTRTRKNTHIQEPTPALKCIRTQPVLMHAQMNA